jgi:hypothetical protein
VMESVKRITIWSNFYKSFVGIYIHDVEVNWIAKRYFKLIRSVSNTFDMNFKFK